MSSPADDHRDTPLARKLAERIRRDGPIDVSDYMAACLGDPELGYYRHRAAIGASADFITAPEISQTFGELIGLWCAVVWQQMGSPPLVHLIELGPGRGTMLRDVLRATRIVPGFHAALNLWLVESNEVLREAQADALASSRVKAHWLRHWSAAAGPEVPEASADLTPLPPGPAIVLANEFLDALPVQQLVRVAGHWHQRAVGLDAANRLELRAGGQSTISPPPPLAATARDGDIYEFSEAQRELTRSLLELRAKQAPLAALFVDYGHIRSALGDTLQAIERHSAVSPLAAPGESDLTAQVDFEAFAGYCGEAGLAVDGPVTQADLLGRLGIVERASRLMAANPSEAASIEASVARLIAPGSMGNRFKALGVRSPGLPTLPGLERQ